MTHLTPAELVDAIDHAPSARAVAHLADCEHCRYHADHLRAVLRDTQSVDVPEPSPLFWNHFSERVRDAVAVEPVPAGGMPVWLRWPVLAPLGALALLLIGLAGSMPRASIPADRVAADARPAPGVGPTDGSVPLDDGPWRAFGELVGDLDWDAATAAGLTIEPDTTYQAVLDLTVDERHELHRLLTAELQRPES